MERNRIYNVDVLDGLAQLDNDSIDCCVTSPPYWGLRDYSTNGQIGLEPTIEEYLEKITLVFKEVKRVLKPEGTLWLNMGDCYASGIGGDRKIGEYDETRARKREQVESLKPKDLVGMPWRVAFALQADGWYLRSDIIWSKPNPMPESVTDRPMKAHEYVFLMSKQPRYFYDADAVKEENQIAFGNDRPCHYSGYIAKTKQRTNKVNQWMNDGVTNRKHAGSGRNKRTVWQIPTQPYSEAHFATFPEKLVEPCILAGTSEKGYCAECGKPWVRVVESEYEWTREKRNDRAWSQYSGLTKGKGNQGNANKINTTIGWQPSCDCEIVRPWKTEKWPDSEIGYRPATIPGLCLDPFMGSGTVALVAHRLDRDFIGFELSEEYCRIANSRIEPEVSQKRLFV